MNGGPATSPRDELIGLLRGQVACPLLSALGELGWLDRMTETKFSPADFPSDVARSNLLSVFRYLAALGLLRAAGDDVDYETTELGRVVFSRYGAFCRPSSFVWHLTPA